MRLLRLVLLALVVTTVAVVFVPRAVTSGSGPASPLPHRVPAASSAGPCLQNTTCGGAGSLVPAGTALGTGLLALLVVVVGTTHERGNRRRRSNARVRLARGIVLDIAHPPRAFAVAH